MSDEPRPGGRSLRDPSQPAPPTGLRAVRWWVNWRQFERPYLGGMLFAVALLGFSGLLSFNESRNLIRTTQYVIQTRTDVALADELFARLNEAETGVFGYLLTGESDSLKPYQTATNRIPALLATLRQFTRDNPEQRARLDQLEPQIIRRLARCERGIGVRRSGGQEPALEWIRQREAGTIMDASSRLIAEIKAAEEKRLLEQEQMARSRARLALWLDIGGNVLSVGLLTVLFAVLLRENARRRRSEASLAKARDELEQRIRERMTELSEANQALQAEVAERRRSELALMDSENLIRAIVNTAVEGVITINERGIIESVNPAAESMFGYAAEEVIGQNVSLLMPLPYRAEHDRYIADYVRTGQAKIIGIGREIVGRRQDGTIFPIDLAVSEVRVAGRRMFTGFLRDITERKRAEEKLGELAHTLAEKNKELETIVYVASHDLRSPLVNIQGFSKELSYACEKVRTLLANMKDPEITRKEIEAILTAEVSEALTFIQAGVSKIDALLAGFLRFSRLGRQAMSIEPLDMAAMLAGIVRTMDYQIRQAGATLRVEPLPDCRGDANLVNQVFSNLIDNALKYLDPARAGVITISGRAENNGSIYAVRDNGIGIAREHQTRIFEIFHRLNPDACEGEGLGLSIAQRILERQRGKIWVESEPGAGSAFFVSLPNTSSLKDRHERNS